jgi:hypothetical protein
MGLFHLITQLRKRERLTGMARRIAERSLDEVACRILALSPEMSLAETRGYIRARAAVVICREVNLLLALDHSVRFEDRTWLTHVATEEVVDALVAQSAQCRAQPLQVEAA